MFENTSNSSSVFSGFEKGLNCAKVHSFQSVQVFEIANSLVCRRECFEMLFAVQSNITGDFFVFRSNIYLKASHCYALMCLCLPLCLA